MHACVLLSFLAGISVSHAASAAVSAAVQEECQRIGHKLVA